MEELQNNLDDVVVDDKNIYNKKVKSKPVPKPNIGIDLDNTVVDKITSVGESSQIDTGEIEGFTTISQARDQMYAALDEMCNDSTIAAILETYAEDATEYNDEGKIVWVDSKDTETSKYVEYLLKSMRIDKNIYKWVYSLCKYGDLYLRLYKESEYDDDLLKTAENNEGKKGPLNENIRINVYSKNDNIVHYMEMVDNPAEIFELTKFGKTYVYIKAPVTSAARDTNYLSSQYLRYSFRVRDIDIYTPDVFVHATLDDNNSRVPEEVQIFNDETSDLLNTEPKYKYKVKHGQSLFFNIFKIWRELSLLENSMLLNRVTKSAILRVISVEVGDMDKNDVGPHLQGIKALMEQKSAINTGKSFNEYTNPGPIENNIYVPTYNGKGAITTTQVGGDVNISQLPDIEYFQNKFFGAMRIPKQYFGLTDDGAGFNGGQSLSIISSRYAKMVKRIQNAVLQALTDAVNIILIDKGMDNSVNNFTLHMTPPTTQEELDRRDNISSKIGLVGDVMNQLSDVEDKVNKLNALKSLLTGTVNSDVINSIEKEIERIEDEGAEEETSDDYGSSSDFGDDSDLGLDLDAELDFNEPEENIEETEVETTPEENLPTPEETGIDMTNFSEEE